MAATNAHEVQAKQVLEEAMNGQLFRARQTYSLGFSSGRFRTTMPKNGMDNLDVDVGDEATAFISREHNAIVFVYGEDDEQE